MNLPKVRSTGIIVQNLDAELLIYNLTTDKAYNLNKTSKIVFEHCDGTKTFAELKRKHKFTDDLIFLALDELKDNDLLENYESNHFKGLSRREAIRKVGLATMIALPVISSLVAPTAAHAQSGSAAAGACNTVGTCYSPGQNICATCAGRRILYNVYTGGAASACSGGSFGGDTTCPADGTPVSNAFYSSITTVI